MRVRGSAEAATVFSDQGEAERAGGRPRDGDTALPLISVGGRLGRMVMLLIVGEGRSWRHCDEAATVTGCSRRAGSK